MISKIKNAPPNSLVLISDSDGGVPPRPARGAWILSTPSCISVGCMTFADGETEFILGAAKDVASADPLRFDGELETPHRTVIVSTVEDNVILKAQVPTVRTRVRVWTNRPTHPDKVVIGLG